MKELITLWAATDQAGTPLKGTTKTEMPQSYQFLPPKCHFESAKKDLEKFAKTVHGSKTQVKLVMIPCLMIITE